LEEIYNYPSVFDVNGPFPRKIAHRYIWAALFDVDGVFNATIIHLIILEKYGVDIKAQVIGKCLVDLCQTKYLERIPVYPSSHHFKYCLTQKFLHIKRKWSEN
jgi:hypothetical protein